MDRREIKKDDGESRHYRRGQPGRHARARPDGDQRAQIVGIADVLPANGEALARAIQWGYQQEDTAFIMAITEGLPPVVNVDDAYASIELCEACYRSAAQDGATAMLPLE